MAHTKKLLVGALWCCLISINPSLAAEGSAVKQWDCTRANVVALNGAGEKISLPQEPREDDLAMPDADADHFTVSVVQAVPNKNCMTTTKKSDVNRWSCTAPYEVESDGFKSRPRSYSLAVEKSENGNEFFGPGGLYFYVDGRGKYVAHYSDDGGVNYLEVGTCNKQ